MANSQDSDDIKISFGLDDDDDDNWENLDLDKMSLVRLFPTRRNITHPSKHFALRTISRQPTLFVR